jgi:hypothetical protein
MTGLQAILWHQLADRYTKSLLGLSVELSSSPSAALLNPDRLATNVAAFPNSWNRMPKEIQDPRLEPKLYIRKLAPTNAYSFTAGWQIIDARRIVFLTYEPSRSANRHRF